MDPHGGGNVGIGVANPQAELAVAGTIKGTEIVVTNAPGADYVFEAGYRLAPLSEVGEFVKANHHLPGIPSAAEMKEAGVSLAEMQAKLLSKIEELTLHPIAAEERSAALEGRNNELAERMTAFEANGGAGPR